MRINFHYGFRARLLSGLTLLRQFYTLLPETINHLNYGL